LVETGIGCLGSLYEAAAIDLFSRRVVQSNRWSTNNKIAKAYLLPINPRPVARLRHPIYWQRHAGRNALPAAMLSMPHSRISFTSRISIWANGDFAIWRLHQKLRGSDVMEFGSH
jgi:hypothetical protein